MITRGGSQPRPGAIRTFLIADIRGYTLFTNQLGDEAASRLAAKFAQIVAEGVEAWDGALVELRGDEALAVFDSPRRAIRCAVELQLAFGTETAREPHLPLTVGIGIDAGEAVPVGEGYRGAALNLAARLCATAAAGEIRASESVAHLAGPIDGLSLSRLEPAEFKGIAGSVVPVLVASHEAGDPSSVPLPHPRPSTVLPPELDSVVPFAGRQRELRRLSWHWRRASHGRSRVVLLTGPEGIGKTRTAAQLAAFARSQGATVEYRSGTAAQPDAAPALTEGSSLLVVDDLDRAASTDLANWATWLASPAPARLTILTSRKGPSDELSALMDAVAPIDELELGPLDSEAVLDITRLYVADAVDEVPLHLIEAESDGVPASVHRVASQWARSHAIQRLGRSAQRTASGRRELRSAEDALIDDVGGLERSRERTLLFAADAEADAETRASVCPYKGLTAFEASDADYFFGRDRLVAELVAKLVGSPFVALVGASGSGKSSLLGAGLLPALANGVLPTSAEWTYVTMRPGSHPLRELRDALAMTEDVAPGADDAASVLERVRRRLTPSQRLLLVVDQFEELFAAPDETERLEFIDLLTRRQTGLKVIVALRADQYGRAAAYPALARALGTDQVLVGPATTAELSSIVERPAQRAGLRVEPQLTEALVTDAGQEPGALPLLSTALLELWQVRTDSTLTMAAYVERGGLRGAVARLAEAAFGAFTPDEQETARSVFLRLAGEGEGDSVVRRRVPIDEFDSEPSSSARRLIAMLAEARLLSTGDGYVEVAHEALFREWPRLVRWLEDDATGPQLRLHLVGTARGWDEAGREPGDLYRGARLAAVLDWAAEHEVELNATERAFIAASRDTARDEAIRQQATNRRLRLLLGGAVVFLVAAVAAGGVAFVQAEQARSEAARADLEADRAEQEEAAAERAEAIARSRELAASAIAYMDDDPSLSKLLALAGASVADPPIETVAALHQAWAEDRIVAWHDWGTDRPVGFFAADMSPDGRLVAMGGWDAHEVEVLDAMTGASIWSFAVGDEHFMSPPYFSSDGDRLVFGVMYAPGPDSPSDPPAGSAGVFVLSAATGEVLDVAGAGVCGAGVLGLGNNVAVVATMRNEAPCQEYDNPGRELLDLRTGERRLLTEMGGEGTISADDRTAAYDDLSTDRFTGLVVDVATGRELLRIEPADVSSDSFVRRLNADGSLLLYGDRPMQVWDVATGEQVSTFDGHIGKSESSAFSADGQTVFSAGGDYTLRQWDARSGVELARYNRIGFSRVAIARNGLALVSRPDGNTGTAVVTSLGLRGEAAAVETCRGFVHARTLDIRGNVASFSISGCEPGKPGVSMVVDMAGGAVVGEIEGLASSQDAALSPDGHLLARQDGGAGEYGSMTIRDSRTGALVVELDGACPYQDDGSRVEGDPPPAGCTAAPVPPFPLWAGSVAWSPDSTLVAVSNNPAVTGGFMVWDARDGELLLARGEELTPRPLIFTPDGSQLLAGVYGEQQRVVRVSVPSGDIEQDVEVPWLGFDFVGYSPDGAVLYVIETDFRGSKLRAVDAESFEELRAVDRVTDGSVQSHSLSPDGSRIAIGSTDGFVRVWDTQTFTLQHEIFIGEVQPQGVAIVSPTRLAVVPETGGIQIYTTATDELIKLVRESLSRGLTDRECQRFNFNDDCPTLEEMRAGA